MRILDETAAQFAELDTKVAALTDEPHVVKIVTEQTGTVASATDMGAGLGAGGLSSLAAEDAGMAAMSEKQIKGLTILDSAMNDTGSAGEKAFGRVKASSDKSYDSTQKLGRSMDDMGSKWGGLLAQGLAIGGIAAAVMGVKGVVDATSSAQTAVALLNTAFQNTKSSLPQSAIDQLDDSMAKFGHDGADANTALANLTTASGSAKDAMADMSAVADLAAHNHESLTDASKQFTLAAEGQGRSIKALGIAGLESIPSFNAMAAAQAAVTKAQDDVNKAMGDSPATAAKMAKAQDDVTAAEAKYEEALTKNKAGSTEVIAAQAALTAAQEKAAAVGGTSNTALAAATDKLSAAQQKLAQDTAMTQDPMQNQAQLAQELEDKLHGSAQAASETMGGALATLKANFTNLAANIGQQLIPVIEGLSGWYSDNAETIQNVLSTAITAVVDVIKTFADALGIIFNHMQIFGPILGGLAAGFVTWKVAMLATKAIGMAEYLGQMILQMGIAASAAYAEAGAQGVLNAVMDANPIGLVVVAIAALVAGFILVATHTQQLGDLFKAVWGDIQKIVGDVVSFIESHWQLMLGLLTGGLGIAVLFVIDHFTQIRDFIGGIVSDIGGFFSALGTGVSDIFQGIASTIGSIISGIVSTVKGIINVPIGVINDVINIIDGIKISVPSWVPGIGGDGWDGLGIPDIPTLASGGIATAPTLALIGEAGPEAIVPLSQGSNAFGSSTNVHIDLRGSQVMSDADMNVLIQKIGYQFVTNHLPGAGISLSR